MYSTKCVFNFSLVFFFFCVRTHHLPKDDGPSYSYSDPKDQMPMFGKRFCFIARKPWGGGVDEDIRFGGSSRPYIPQRRLVRSLCRRRILHPRKQNVCLLFFPPPPGLLNYLLTFEYSNSSADNILSSESSTRNGRPALGIIGVIRRGVLGRCFFFR